MTGAGPSVALAHDYLNQRGGAERVALELSHLWPDAPLYTALYRPNSTFPEFRDARIRTCFLDRVPVDTHFRGLFPLYPLAVSSLGPIDADVLIASSSGWAHGFRVAGEGKLMVYCHNPARWLYGEPYLNAGAYASRVVRPLLPWLRRWDRRAAARADIYIANSRTTRARIMAAYGIEATVINPPVDTHRFRPTPRGERLLCVSRLLPYKRVDVVVRAATAAGIGLDVVGIGPAYASLAAMAGPTVTFHGAAPDPVVTELMQTCRAFCLPGVEDFGISPVEAQAAGKPVVALAAGGALETIERDLTGTFFHDPEPDAFLDALHAADALDTSPDLIAESAARFSVAAFAQRMRSEVERALAGDRSPRVSAAG